MTERTSIHIVGANPSMDRTQFVSGFAVGEVNRAVRAEPMAGGKGLIVARAMARLGTRTAVYGFVGGVTGQYIRDECARLGLVDRHTAVDGDTRINAIIVDERTDDATVVNEPGPVVSGSEADAFFAELAAAVAPGDIVALSGSLPRGLDADFAARVIDSVQALGGRTIIDTSGATLATAVAARPWAVKCNLAEFRELRPVAPAEVTGPAERRCLYEQMHALLDAGIEVVAITLGADGAIAVSASEAVQVRPPRIDVVNATGSGDTFLAGLLHVLGADGDLSDAVQLAVAASAANALVPLPDLGPDPDLSAMRAEITTEVLTDGAAS